MTPCAPLPVLLVVAIALGIAACSAPPLMPELAEAERLEKQGHTDEALAAYQRAQTACMRMADPKQRKPTCREAHLAHAELLDRSGQHRRAADEYRHIPDVLDHDPLGSAEALYRSGRIYLALGDDQQAYTLLWRTVTDYPEQEFAADALKILVHDGRKRNARELHDQLARLLRAMPESIVADNFLYYMASLAKKELGAPKLAISYYDELAAHYPDSGLRDDAYWYGAELARAQGDARGAVRRLRELASTREVSFGTGSYLSVWHDNGQLELATVLRDDLGEPRKAAHEFHQLPELYPASVLRDDARYGEAVAWSQAGDTRRACKALATLHREQPDSKYELHDAPALRAKLGCEPPAGSNQAKASP